MKNRIAIIIILLLPAIVYAQDLSNYLILSDVGEYKYRPRRTLETYGNSGALISAGHFDLDHADILYETHYIHPVTILSVDVQVTQHIGADSDKWLLHEVEDSFRDGNIDKLGLLTKGTRLKDINGKKYVSLRGSGYAWISNYVVVEILYSDLNGNKPEPTEVIQTYLQKFPSTISSSLVFDSVHDVQWIKDEMDRRLWLADKWFVHIQSSDPKNGNKLKSLTDSMVIFLDYREKYFSVNAKNEKIALETMLLQNNIIAIQAKLTEFKTWWSEHKGNSIMLP